MPLGDAIVGLGAWMVRIFIELVFYSVFWGIGWFAITVFTFGRIEPRTIDEDIVSVIGILVVGVVVGVIVLLR